MESTAYPGNAILENRDAKLPSLSIQYVDFTLWQRKYLEEKGKNYRKLLAYWKAQLKGAPSMLKLPTDYPRPLIQSYKGHHRSFSLPAELIKKLKELSEEVQGTLFMTLLSAFYTLLYRYSEQDDIVVGIPVANRNQEAIEPLIGFFVNTLALRTNLSQDLSFKDFLKQVRNKTLEAYDHQDFPFEKLVDHLKIERSLSYESLFQVMFVLQTANREYPFSLKEIKIEALDFEYPLAKFDLTLSLTEETDGRLKGFFEYATDLFQASTIERMIRHYQYLLEDIVVHSTKPLSQLKMLSPGEEQQVLTDWNDTQRSYPENKTIHELFEKQVEQTPNNIAVVYEDQALTYQELNQKANQLAHYLREEGIQPDTPIGIISERSLEMIVGVLGILKAGGAYVPLDPSYPQKRLSHILEDTQASFLLIQENVLDNCPRTKEKVVFLNKEQDRFSAYPITNPSPITKSHHLAYILYTSGSTGNPKGVMIEHKAVNRLVTNQNYICFDSSVTMAHMSNVSFDAATFEIWGALLCGGRLIIIPKEVVLFPEKLDFLLKHHNINTAFLTTALFNRLLDENLNIFRKIKYLMVGGEIADSKRIKQQIDARNTENFIHVYGPTESTTFSTYYLLKDSESFNDNVPIGRPIINTQIYILDSNLSPVPVGVTGEIHIGGEGLARGYLNQSDLTAEKFISNPFQTEKERNKNKNSRLYKTGDLARYLPNGNVEFIGRIDHQVKIRGYRIELGEIEHILLQHPQIKEAIVIAREDIPGDKRLVAYLIFLRDTLDAAKLRVYLKKSLPEQMVPSAFVALETFPLTANAKIDLKALPAPEYQKHEKTYVAPQTETEKILCEIWEKVLKIERVGIYDNFFELGGHSLLATQVVSRLRSHYQVELPLREFFKTPVVLELAKCIKLESMKHGTLPLIPQPRQGRIPLSFAQQRLWFIDQLNPQSALYNIPLALKLKGTLNLKALQRALNNLIKRHEVLRTSIKIHEGKPYQEIRSTLKINLSIIDLSFLKGKEQEEKAKEHIQKEILKSFNLENDPLIRANLIKLAKKEHIFLLTLHHSIADGWSMSILGKELSEVYNAELKGFLLHLLSLPVQYADFTLWQREYLKETGTVYQEQISYWTEQLKGAHTLLELPTDHMRPAIQSYQGKQKSFKFSSSLIQKLKTLSEDQHTTLFMTLLSTFYVFLYRYSGEEDIIIGSPIANRNREEIEHLIGFFVNTLALRTTLSPQASFKEFLAQVKEKTLSAYDHQDLPFEKLIDVLRIERSLSHEPLFQVMFTLQNAERTIELNLDGVTNEEVSFDYSIAKFDLALNLMETQEGLQGSFEYAIDLFKGSTVERMIKHYKRLLEDIVAHPDKEICQLEMLTKQEKKKILIEWNRTQKEYFQNKLIHQFFEEQVERVPNNIAVVYEGQELTYQELNERANQLAHCLRALDIGPDVFVPISLERSLEMVIGLLGILKAGGAYVPLDPSYPQNRLNFMLEDTKAPILLTQSSLKTVFKDYQGTILLLDEDWKQINHNPTSNPPIINSPHHLVYLIYTSGSTGKPKGVMIEQKNLTNYCRWAIDYYGITKNDKILQNASLSFDLSIEEIFLALLTGAKLVLPTLDNYKDQSSFVSLLNKEEITVIDMVPSAIQTFLGQNKNNALSSLRLIISGGAEISPSIKNNVVKYIKDIDLHNSYGPTETTICTTVFHCTHNASCERIPIGKPIWNASLYIFDPYLNPVPIGIAGELYIGGDGLARGYLNQEKLTAEKFIPNPFQTAKERRKSKNTRLYKTGDLARYLPDGNIEFIGRIDHQVKIRGYRIELGEVEFALLQHPQVKDSIVIAREDIPGDRRLVAYLVLQRESLTITELRSYLKERLPEHMIPSTFVTLKTFPLTVNGKVNRQALPSPEYQINSKDYVAPRTKAEKILCKIWQDLLKIKQIGIHDNFFELGGHSLLAAQLTFKIKEKLNLSVPLREFFNQLTIERLASFIEKNEIGNLSINLKKSIEEDIALEKKFSYRESRSLVVDSSQSILLTGANGFVGINLLKELISKTKGKVYCLIRAKDYLHARARLNETISYYELESLKNEPRIVPLAGDLSQPQLGLNSSLFKSLAREIGHIYHNGAFVHHIYDYFQLRASNVLSTIELLKLAGQEHPKHFSYISTLSAVFDFDQQNRVFLERFPETAPQGTEGGYSISKWVSEKILSEASQKGVNISIYRLPQILGDSLKGISPIDKNHFMLMIKGCMEMGFAPNIERTLNALPVDFAAKFVVDSSLATEWRNKVFNLSSASSPSFTQVFNWIKEFGFAFSVISYKEWKERIASISENNSFFPLLPLYLESSGEKKDSKENLGAIYENKNFLNFLSARGIFHPKADKKQFRIYFKYLQSQLRK